MISSYELAKLCGVSQGTVDRAIHDRPGVSASTRTRIKAAAQAYGYLANPVTHEMMGLATSTMVAVVAPEAAMQRAFFMDLFAALSPHLRAQGLVPSLWLSGEGSANVNTTFSEVVARRPRAVLLIIPPSDLTLPVPLVRPQPVISLVVPCTSPGVINVLPDEQDIGRTATEHLLMHGHRRILHITGGRRPHWARQERATGYEQAMRDAGLSPNIIWEAVEEDGVVDRLLASKATGVFCHNDRIALVLIERLRARGMSVPQDLSVIGVDRSPIMRSFDLGLTTVPYPLSWVVARSVAHITGGAIPEPSKAIVISDRVTVATVN